MHINEIDLNLLRLFDAVYRTRNVSRAAELLDLTQPAASQGLTRLRALIHDPLFMRAAGGVQPTPKADRLADPVRLALVTLEQALSESAGFEPLQSRRSFRIHMSDIGEGPLPAGADGGAAASGRPACGWKRCRCRATEITEALDSGRIDFAFGFLPMVKDTQRAAAAQGPLRRAAAQGPSVHAQAPHRQGPAGGAAALEFVAVRTHADTLAHPAAAEPGGPAAADHRTLHGAAGHRRATDLAVVMPRNIARGFPDAGGYAIVEPAFPLRDFAVSLHWSQRFEADPGNRWLRQAIVEIFKS